MHGSELNRLLSNLNVHLKAVAICEISRGMTLVFDALDYVVVHHVLRGQGILEVEGCAPIPFGPDSMLLIPAGCTKRVSVSGLPAVSVMARQHCSTDPSKLLRLDGTGGAPADLTIACGALHVTCAAFKPFSDLRTPLVEDMSTISAVRVAFEAMLLEQARPALGTSAIISALMKQCLLLFIRRHSVTNGVAALSLALSDERLTRALNAILEHPGELRMKDLAASACMSRSAFARRFAEALHTTPMQFYRQTRLQRAAELLEATDLPVKKMKIASEAGYLSRSQFCRSFRAAFSTSPTEYRRREQATLALVEPLTADVA